MGPTARLAAAGVRRRGIGQVAALVVVTALAAAAVVAGLAGQRSTADVVDAAYERAGRPDVVLSGTAEALVAAAGDPAVAAASPPRPRAVGATVVDGESVEVAVTAVDGDDLPPVGTPDLVGGRWPAGDREVVVEHSLVSEGVTSIGATLRVTSARGAFDLQVVGSAVELTDCFWPNCDPLRVLGTAALVEAVRDPGQPPVHTASYRLHDPRLATAVGSRLLRDGGHEHVFGQNTWPDTRGDILVVGEVFGAMVTGFGAFLLVAACVVVAGATAARLVARRRSLGLLRAVGFRPAQLAVAVLAEHAAIGAGGVVLGWVVGSLAAPSIAGVPGIPDAGSSSFSPGALAAAIVLVEAVLAVAVALPAWRAGRQPASDVLRDVPAAPAGGRWVAAVARRLGAGPSAVAGLRRAFARPVRAGLAAVAVLVATVGAFVATGFIGSVHGAVDDPARTGSPFDVVVAGLDGAAVEAALAAEPGIDGWYRERETSGVVGPASYAVRVTGGDPGDARFVVREGRPLEGAGEALVGYAFLRETGLEVGDRLSIAVDGTTVDAAIVGWYLDAADAGKVVRLREESLPGIEGPTTHRVVVDDGVEPDVVAAALAERLGPAALVEVPDPDDAGVGAIIGTLVGFAVLLGAVAAANLLATTVTAARERARALGVLRTVGCTTGQLVAQSALGAAAIALVAAGVGVPVGLVVFDLLADAVTQGVGIGDGLARAPSPWFTAAVVPVAVAVSAAVGALAVVGLSRRPAAALVRYE